MYLNLNEIKSIGHLYDKFCSFNLPLIVCWNGFSAASSQMLSVCWKAKAPSTAGLSYIRTIYVIAYTPWVVMAVLPIHELLAFSRIAHGVWQFALPTGGTISVYKQNEMQAAHSKTYESNCVCVCTASACGRSALALYKCICRASNKIVRKLIVRNFKVILVFNHFQICLHLIAHST